MVQLAPQLLQWLYNVLAPEYRDPQRTYSDSANALSAFPSLRPRTAVYTDDSGRSDLLLCLYGSLPTSFNGTIYHIPVEIWVPKQYPYSIPPIVYVRPTEDMMISPSNYVDTNGRCYHPYLAYWTNSASSNLHEMISLFTDAFSRLPPVFAKPKHQLPSFTNTVSTRSSTASSSSYNHAGPPEIPPKPELPKYWTGTSPSMDQYRQVPAAISASPHAFAYSQNTPIPQKSILDIDTITVDNNPVKPPNPEKARALDDLRASLNDIIENKVKKAITMDQNALKQTKEALEWIEKTLNQEKQVIERVERDCSSNKSILKERIESAKTTIDDAASRKIPPIDELILAETVVYNQLYNLVASDQALDDTFFVLDKAFEQGKIELNIYMKQTRALAREQFMDRALINKISTDIGLA